MTDTQAEQHRQMRALVLHDGGMPWHQVAAELGYATPGAAAAAARASQARIRGESIQRAPSRTLSARDHAALRLAASRESIASRDLGLTGDQAEWVLRKLRKLGLLEQSHRRYTITDAGREAIRPRALHTGDDHMARLRAFMEG